VLKIKKIKGKHRHMQLETEGKVMNPERRPGRAAKYT